MSKHIAVLMGGISAERAVSLVSGEACASALEKQGYKVTRIDATRDLGTTLTKIAPDIAFNALHGMWGEDGCVQGILETLQIPYTHSGVLASALAMDKNRAKGVLRQAGINVPGGGLFKRHQVATRHVLPLPYIVKPNAQGSSVGVIRIMEGANKLPTELLESSWPYGDDVLVEPYIPGRELTVTVLGEATGPRALAVTEIIPNTSFYDYEAKYAVGGSAHVVPADLPSMITEAALRMAEHAHHALGCRGITRTDLRYDAHHYGLFALEVNTQPGMTPTSLTPEQAAYAGMDFDALVHWLAEDASCKR